MVIRCVTVLSIIIQVIYSSASFQTLPFYFISFFTVQPSITTQITVLIFLVFNAMQAMFLYFQYLYISSSAFCFVADFYINVDNVVLKLFTS